MPFGNYAHSVERTKKTKRCSKRRLIFVKDITTKSCSENVEKKIFSWSNCIANKPSQLTFTWSKSLIETLEKDVKYVQS